jgi:hypothetical protein
VCFELLGGLNETELDNRSRINRICGKDGKKCIKHLVMEAKGRRKEGNEKRSQKVGEVKPIFITIR